MSWLEVFPTAPGRASETLRNCHIGRISLRSIELIAPFRLLVAFAALLVLAAFTAAIIHVARHGGAPRSFGWRDAPEADAWVIDRVDAGSSAAGRLRVGDRLVAFDGDTLVGRYGAQFYRRTFPIGQSYTLQIERDGEIHAYALTVGAGPSRLNYRVTVLVVCMIWCAVGLFIGFARPDDAEARLAFAVAVGTGLVYIQVNVFQGFLPGSMYQPLHVVLGYHFFYRFPGGIKRGRLATVLLWSFYALGVVACILRQGINLVFFTEGAGAVQAWLANSPVLSRLGGLLGNALAAPLALASAVLIATTYRRLTDPDLLRRIRWVVFSSLAGLSPLVLWAAVAVTDGIMTQALSPISPESRRFVNDATLLGTSLIPVGMAYAIGKHRVFDISVVVRRGLQYLLAKRALQTLLALPAFSLAIALFVNRDQTINQFLNDNATVFLLVGGIALTLRYRQPLSLWLDRRFFREQYNRDQVFDGLLAELAGLSEPGDITHLVRARVEYALHPSLVRLWFDGDPDPPSEKLLQAFAGRRTNTDEPLTSTEYLPDGVSVAVPVESGDSQLAGVLLLGEKRSDEPYSAKDLSLLGAVAKQAAMVRENLLLRKQIGEERRVRTEVLAHLGPDKAGLMKECTVCGTCYDSDVEHCSSDGNELSLTLPVSRVVNGRYRLDALLGRGGMGSVYEAVDMRLKRVVAIKFLFARSLGQDHALRRFRREARSLARIHHHNIVSVYDYGGLEGQGAYLVMERIRGVTLRDELARRGRLTGPEAASWFTPILDGVAAAHEEGIVHRDLKPENVIRLRPDYGPAVVKILDFGIAKVRPVDTAGDHLTETGAVVGTFGYMSPEQLTGHEVDARSDIFSIGVMLVESLTGSWPFKGDTYGEILAAIVLDPYHMPCSSPEARKLDEVLQRCLAKEPSDRFTSAAALRDELVPILETVLTLPLSIA